MNRFRTVLGMSGGVLLLVSTAMHSTLGWQHMRSELVKVNAPPALVFGFEVGWQFGGVAMAAFGLVALSLLVRRMRGLPAPAAPLWIVALAHGGFGAWALVSSSFDPFFWIFIVPAALIAIAAPGSEPR